MFKKFLIFALGIGAGVAIVKRDTVCEKIREGINAATNKFNECCGSSKCECKGETENTFDEVK